MTSQSGQDEDDDAKSQKSRKADNEVAEQINRDLEALKFEIPASCLLSFPKTIKIEKLEAKYLLLAHPFPTFEGEMILAQPKKDD